MTMTTTAGSLAKQAENFAGIDFTPLASSRPDPAKLIAIQASLIQTAVALSDSAQYLAGHFYPESIEAMRNTAAMLKSSAENLQPAIDIAEALRKSKSAKSGEVWDAAPSVVQQLNAANKAFWQQRGAK